MTVQYLLSFLATMEQVIRINAKTPNSFHLGLYTLSNESLVARGRNHIAQVAVQGGWDKLFFIDADAGWSFDQFAAVATSPTLITAGTCPLKTYPISLNYLPFQDDEHFYKDAVRSPESLQAMRQGHGKPLIAVPFVGTAFMCIDTSVLKKLTETANPYQYPNPQSGNLETHWDFFKTEPVSKKYMSEDWGFCHMARANGFDVHIHADVIIQHVGSHVFKAQPSQAAPAIKGEEYVISSDKA